VRMAKLPPPPAAAATMRLARKAAAGCWSSVCRAAGAPPPVKAVNALPDLCGQRGSYTCFSSQHAPRYKSNQCMAPHLPHLCPTAASTSMAAGSAKPLPVAWTS
jgi:hypothetical protein